MYAFGAGVLNFIGIVFLLSGVTTFTPRGNPKLTEGKFRELLET